MNFKQLIQDEDAVSPVIGVILMVAITVILAAVIATFVLGLGESVSQNSPQASFSFDYTADTNNGGSTAGVVEVTHQGGDSIPPARLSVVGSETIEASTGGSNSDDTLTFDESSPDGFGLSDDVTAGTTVEVYEAGAADSTNDFDDATLRITYTGESGDSSATLGKWEGPDA